MERITMVATRRFIGEEGRVNKGDTLHVTPERSRQLLANRAARMEQESEVGGKEKKPTAPRERRGGKAGAGQPSSASQAGRASGKTTASESGGGDSPKPELTGATEPTEGSSTEPTESSTADASSSSTAAGD